MMLVTLLLLFLNSNTHATESYDSLTWELTTYKKGDYHGLKKYTIKNLKDNQNVNIKSKLKYKLKSGADATSEKEIPFNIEVYYPKDTNDDVVKEEIKRMYLDQIKINDIIKNGINNDTFKSCNEKIYPLIYLDRASKDDKIYYDLRNNKFVNGYEKWICYYCTNQLRALDAIDCSRKQGAKIFIKDYINKGNPMPQEKLLITIYHRMTINNVLVSDYYTYIPYFEQYEDFQKYAKNKVGDKTKIIYEDDYNNYKLIKDDESYKECKKDRKSVRLKCIKIENLKALKKKDKECYEKFLQSINKTEEDLEKEEAERIKKETEEKEKLKKEEEERKRKEDEEQARKKAEEEGRKKEEEENKKKLEEEDKKKAEKLKQKEKEKEEEEKEKKEKKNK